MYTDVFDRLLQLGLPLGVRQGYAGSKLWSMQIAFVVTYIAYMFYSAYT